MSLHVGVVFIMLGVVWKGGRLFIGFFWEGGWFYFYVGCFCLLVLGRGEFSCLLGWGGGIILCVYWELFRSFVTMEFKDGTVLFCVFSFSKVVWGWSVDFILGLVVTLVFICMFFVF